MGACLTPAEVEAWGRDELGEVRRGRCERHAAACEACRAAIAAARADEALLRELRAVARPAAPAGDPAGDPARNDGSQVEPAPEGGIPGYDLEEELFRGGQGVVHRARQRSTGRVVALKVLLRGRRASTRERLRFEREVELVSRLRHPDVVTILDSGVAAGRPWLAMEYVEGRRLDEHVAATRPALDAKLRLFVRIAEAVAAAHRRGVIHRDLKPGNILVDAEGNPRVLDFGVAKASDEDRRARVTATGEFLGTLAYAAPEQVAGDPDEVDTRTDVHALGLLLYEMLTGRLPYPATGRMADVVRAITSTPPADPRELAPEVDAELALVVRTALAKDPDERYPSAEALARDVRHYLAREPLEARGKSAWYVLRKAAARHRAPLATAGAIALVVAAAALALGRERLRVRREAERAELVREIMLDVVGAAAPQRMGSDVTLLEVVEQASGRIEAALDGAPDAQGAFHLAIGDTYRSLFLFDEAEPHLEKALERYRRFDPGGLDLARCLFVAGTCLAASRSDPARGLALHEEALTLRAAALPPGDPLVAASERGVAAALLSQYAVQGDARARRLLDSALEKQRRAFGDDHPEVAETKLWLARVARRAGDVARAERLLLEAMACLETAGRDGGPHPLVVDCLLDTSSLLRSQRRLEEAEALLARSAERIEALEGDHRAVELLRNRSRLFVAKRDFATAEELLRESVVRELARWAERRPEDAARIARVQEELRAARPPAAEPAYARAFAILRECRGNGAFELASWMNDIVDTLREQGRGRAAEPLLEEALRIRCRAFGSDCPIRLDSLWSQARVRVADGRPAEAVAALEEMLATLRRRGEDGGARAAEVRELLRRCRPGAPAQPADAGERGSI